MEVLIHGTVEPGFEPVADSMGESDVSAAKRFDWETMTSAMAVGVPMWEPGTRSEYHGGEFGYLVGGVLQRVDGHDRPRRHGRRLQHARVASRRRRGAARYEHTAISVTAGTTAIVYNVLRTCR